MSWLSGKPGSRPGDERPAEGASWRPPGMLSHSQDLLSGHGRQEAGRGCRSGGDGEVSGSRQGKFPQGAPPQVMKMSLSLRSCSSEKGGCGAPCHGIPNSIGGGCDGCTDHLETCLPGVTAAGVAAHPPTRQGGRVPWVCLACPQPTSGTRCLWALRRHCQPPQLRAAVSLMLRAGELSAGLAQPPKACKAGREVQENNMKRYPLQQPLGIEGGHAELWSGSPARPRGQGEKGRESITTTHQHVQTGNCTAFLANATALAQPAQPRSSSTPTRVTPGIPLPACPSLRNLATSPCRPGLGSTQLQVRECPFPRTTQEGLLDSLSLFPATPAAVFSPMNAAGHRAATHISGPNPAQMSRDEAARP